VVVMDAAHLAFREGSFDTIVSTLGTCTFPDPVQALKEMRRVCRQGGRILLLEHGRSNRPAIATWQDRHAAKWAAHLGCWWNRDPLESVRKAGLEPHATTRGFLGIVQVIQTTV
jgi:ubiquinone/menaquinone biosynthesis C-methylase UbiE